MGYPRIRHRSRPDHTYRILLESTRCALSTFPFHSLGLYPWIGSGPHVAASPLSFHSITNIQFSKSNVGPSARIHINNSCVVVEGAADQIIAAVQLLVSIEAAVDVVVGIDRAVQLLVSIEAAVWISLGIGGRS